MLIKSTQNIICSTISVDDFIMLITGFLREEN